MKTANEEAPAWAKKLMGRLEKLEDETEEVRRAENVDLGFEVRSPYACHADPDEGGGGTDDGVDLGFEVRSPYATD